MSGLELGRVTDRKPPFKYSALTRVGFSDTDAQGIVYYGRYLPYFDGARVEYHRHLGMLERERRDHELVMRANTIEYLAPAHFDDLGLPARRGGAADPLADRNAYVLGRLGPLPRPQHQVVAFDEVDPDPRVVLEPSLQHFDRLGERVVGAADRRECLVVTHHSRSSPSKAAIGPIMSSGIG